MTFATSVKHDTFELRSSTTLFAQSWTPATTLCGTVGIVHGLGEHSSRYAQFAGRLAAEGYRVVGYDQRGHGRTEGKRGDAPSYEDLLDDVEALIVNCRAENPNLPIYLFGQSFGGNLVLNYALRRRSNLAGVIASSPLLQPTHSPPRWKQSVARVLACVYSSFTFHTGVQAEQLSHDPAVVAAYQADPLVHDQVSARLAVAMLEAGEWALEHAAKLSVPTLLLHGSADAITSVDATFAFAQRAGDRSKLHTFPGLFHELHWEREGDALQVIVDWLG